MRSVGCNPTVGKCSGLPNLQSGDRPCAGLSIESCLAMLTEATRTMPSLDCRQANMDFCEAQVPFYINGCKSSLNWRELPVGKGRKCILITHWNVASWGTSCYCFKFQLFGPLG